MVKINVLGGICILWSNNRFVFEFDSSIHPASSKFISVRSNQSLPINNSFYCLCRYLYTDALQEYKYALEDIHVHYKSEIGKVLDPGLREYINDKIQRFGSDESFINQIMKEQLRIYLQRKEMFNVPFITGIHD